MTKSWQRLLTAAAFAVSASLGLTAVSTVQAKSPVRAQLTAGQLQSASQLEQPTSLAPWAEPSASAAPSQSFQGRLILDNSTPLAMEVLRDDYRFAQDASNRVAQLPDFDFQFVQDGADLIPLTRGSIASVHPRWEYILEPGRVWQESGDQGYSRASLPFSLQERDSNCMHNGVITFIFRDSGAISQAAVAIASETCLYFKFNLWGLLGAQYQPAPVATATQLKRAFAQQRQATLPALPLQALLDNHPDIDLNAFAGAGKLKPEHMTSYGFVMDGIHYRSACPTRAGNHPFCDVLSLPSYSTAKTLVAGLALMRLEQLYPGSRHALIADYVPECRASGNWADVSFEQALNMLTGNYGSAIGREDEASKRNDDEFFYRSSHREKISFSCNAWPRQAKPGSRWVYHTTDTYILGTAINAFLSQRRGGPVDLYRDLVLPLWQPMTLSPALAISRRTDDSIAQAFTGFGLTLQRDDVARLATALNQMAFADELDPQMYGSAMQRAKTPQGSYPVDQRYYYQHGFWAYDAAELLGCEQPVPVPFMSGYGGINVVMMPNDTVYYYFSDGGKFAFTDLLLQSHQLRSLCPIAVRTPNKGPKHE